MENIFDDYKRYNRLTGIASAAGEFGTLVSNIDRKRNFDPEYEKINKVSPQLIDLKPVDVKTGMIQDVNKAYKTGIMSARESGRNNFESMLGQTIASLEKANLQQAAIDTETKNKEIAYNAEARMKADLTNLDVERMNTQMKMQQDQFEFQADSMFSSEIAKSTANIGKILSQIPLNEIMMQMELERMKPPENTYMDEYMKGKQQERNAEYARQQTDRVVGDWKASDFALDDEFLNGFYTKMQRGFQIEDLNRVPMVKAPTYKGR